MGFGRRFCRGPLFCLRQTSTLQELDRKRRANDQKKAAKRASRKGDADAMPEATESRHRSYEQLLEDRESSDEETEEPGMTAAAYLRDDADDETPMDLMDNRMAGNIAANKPAKRRTGERYGTRGRSA